MIQNKFLFNFAVSHSGGGFKRLYAYAKWFHQNGGAWFIIHPHCGDLINQFRNNRFFIVNQTKAQRFFNDCSYLDSIRNEISIPDMYYSYGIPIYSRFGKINWFHLSNVLPLSIWGIPLSLFDKVKLGFLGWRIEKHFKQADVISAESEFSLTLIDQAHAEKFFVSVNGSDDEISSFQLDTIQKKNNMAVVVGTYRYKSLEDSYRIFEMLRENNYSLMLLIIGDKKRIPRYLRIKKGVIMTGMLSQDEVIAYLRRASYYISTTRIENSYNAASEGIFFANESYISDIGPHQELLAGMSFERITPHQMKRPVLHVKKKNVSSMNLKSWDKVIAEMIAHTMHF